MNDADAYKKLIEANISSSASHADDVSKRWLATLGVGNGAALLGCAAVIVPTENVLALYRLLPSMWMFLFGVVTAFLALGALGAAWRHDESEWRYEAANDTWRRIGREDEIVSELPEQSAGEASRSRTYATVLAIASMAAFVAGVGYPLTIATWLAIHGNL